ncbi:MAG: cobalamin biosynthesis protein [Chloroflexi bacterium]|nr:cobalamin biosynthesis protein [Chloroflexota bacterium]
MDAHIQDILVLVLAVSLDVGMGEMPSAVHPVVAMGGLLSFGFRRTSSHAKTLSFLQGCIVVVLVAGVFGAAAYVTLYYARMASPIVYLVAGAVLLKSSFSVRGLGAAAARVRKALSCNDLDGARREVRSLVSRDTAALGAHGVVGAAVESVAENTSDSFVAPVFYFLLFGIPGAVVYRVFNTADAMVGYHGKFEYLGKGPARIDDALNFLPARITGLLLVIASLVARANPMRAWRIMRRDHGRTESPNAGWPMAAMAGSLDVRLEKTGHYQLGDAGEALMPDHITRSVQLMGLAVGFWVLTGIVTKAAQYAIAA